MNFWIITYVVLVSVGDNLSANLGVKKIVTLPILVVLSMIMYFFVRKNDLTETYGLCKPQISSAKMLFYAPLIILSTANLWHGVVLNNSPAETLLYIVSMLLVGFLEEMIFRGFLFNAMAKDNVKSAIIVSNVTFGMGHIVNLINGSGTELLPNLLQVIYAIAIGFAFVMVYYKTKSLLFCIMTHGILNGLGTFANKAVMTPQKQIVLSVLVTIIAGGYALYIALMVKEENNYLEIYR